MPTYNGDVLCQKLVDSGYNNPIIAVTAMASKSEIDVIMQSPFAGYISKPIEREALLQIGKDHLVIEALKA
jgi:CheY-like chemotaxis protein